METIKVACVCKQCGRLTDTTIPVPVTAGRCHRSVSDPQGKPVAFVKKPLRIDLKKHHRDIMAMVETDMTFTAMAASIGCTLGGMSGYLRRMGITARTRRRHGKSNTDENATRGACSHIGHSG